MIEKINREEAKQLLKDRCSQNRDATGILEFAVLILNKQDEIIDKLNELEEKIK